MFFFFFSSKRPHKSFAIVSWARRCVKETAHKKKREIERQQSPERVRQSRKRKKKKKRKIKKTVSYTHMRLPTRHHVYISRLAVYLKKKKKKKKIIT